MKMKTRRWIFLFAAFLFFSSARAQGLLDKVDRALNKADRAANSADKAGKLADKAGKMVGKKKDTKDEGKVDKGNETVISIAGIDYSKLQELQESIKSYSGVASTSSKFNKKGSSIKVVHSSTTEDLLKEILKKSGKIVTKESIEGVGDGEISISLK